MLLMFFFYCFLSFFVYYSILFCWVFIWFLVIFSVNTPLFLVYQDCMNVLFVMVLYVVGFVDNKGFFFNLMIQWCFITLFVVYGFLFKSFSSFFCIFFSFGILSKLYLLPFGVFYLSCLSFVDSFSSVFLIIWFTTMPFLVFIFGLLDEFGVFELFVFFLGLLLFSFVFFSSSSSVVDIILLAVVLSAYFLMLIFILSFDSSSFSFSLVLYVFTFTFFLSTLFISFDFSLLSLPYYGWCFIFLIFILFGFHITTFWKFSLLFDFMSSSYLFGNVVSDTCFNFISFVFFVFMLFFPLGSSYAISSFFFYSSDSFSFYLCSFSFSMSHFSSVFSLGSIVSHVVFFWYLFFPFVFVYLIF